MIHDLQGVHVVLFMLTIFCCLIKVLAITNYEAYIQRLVNHGIRDHATLGEIFTRKSLKVSVRFGQSQPTRNMSTV